MIRPEVFSIALSFSVGLIIGAGIAWSLVMFVWEPIEAEEEKTDFDIM